MPDLSDLIPFYSGQVENSHLLVLGQVQMQKTSKIFFGQVHYGHLLVPGQVENFTISTPLSMNPDYTSPLVVFLYT